VLGSKGNVEFLLHLTEAPGVDDPEPVLDQAIEEGMLRRAGQEPDGHRSAP
jgi:hypothetical protein